MCREFADPFGERAALGVAEVGKHAAVEDDQGGSRRSLIGKVRHGVAEITLNQARRAGPGYAQSRVESLVAVVLSGPDKRV